MRVYRFVVSLIVAWFLAVLTTYVFLGVWFQLWAMYPLFFISLAVYTVLLYYRGRIIKWRKDKHATHG